MSSPSVNHFFDQYAKQFDAIYGQESNWVERCINRYFRRSMAIRFEKSIEGCRPLKGRTVLDVGCGPGHYVISLVREGAQRVVGMDLSSEMIKLASAQASAEGFSDRCGFIHANFMGHDFVEKFDFVIVMGVMDYIENSQAFVSKILDLTKTKAFFSFPKAGGILAWQRKWRYRNRCPLFLYHQKDVQKIFKSLQAQYQKFECQSIARDFFITVWK